MLLDVEDRLRYFIKAVFHNKQSDWEKLIPEAVRNRLATQPSSVAGPDLDPLGRATLRQLIEILLARWTLFEPILYDKMRVNAYLSDLCEWRNKLAHGAHPTEDQRVQIAFVAAEAGRRIPGPASQAVPAPEPAGGDYGLWNKHVLWVDNVPENNRRERRWLQELGAEVVPVLSNEEAVDEAKRQPFQVAISDIDRNGAEPGSLLGTKLYGAGINIPIVFFVAELDPGRPPPFGGVGITNDPALLLKMTIEVLRIGGA